MHHERWVRATSAAALAAGGLEAVSRLLEPHLAVRPLVWHDKVAQHKALEMVERRRQGAGGGWVVAGNSMVLVGLQPSTWAAAAGVDGPVYNAALHRGVPTVTERWLLEEVAPVLRPHAVLYGVSVLDFNDRGLFHERITHRYEAAPRTARRGRRRVVAAFLRRSAAGRVAPSLIQPRVVAGAALRAIGRRPPAASPAAELVGPDGWGTEFAGARPYRHTENNRGWLATSILVDYEAGGRQTRSFVRTVDALRARGTLVEATLLPVTADFADAMPGGAAHYDEAVEHIASTCRAHGVPLDDVTSAFGGLDGFADSFHLHGDGARRFSERSGAARRARLAGAAAT